DRKRRVRLQRYQRHRDQQSWTEWTLGYYGNICRWKYRVDCGTQGRTRRVAETLGLGTWRQLPLSRIGRDRGSVQRLRFRPRWNQCERLLRFWCARTFAPCRLWPTLDECRPSRRSDFPKGHLPI